VDPGSQSSLENSCLEPKAHHTQGSRNQLRHSGEGGLLDGTIQDLTPIREDV